MTSSNPISNPGLYNAITIGSVRWPPPGEETRVEVSGASSLRNWEKVASGGLNASQGLDGVTIKYTGAGIAEFTVKFYVWEPHHFDYFESAVRPLFGKPRPAVKPQAYPIEYPELQKLQIDRVVIVEVGMLEIADPTGLWFYPVKFLEHRVKKRVQVLKAKANPGGTIAATVNTQEDVELREAAALVTKARAEMAAAE